MIIPAKNKYLALTLLVSVVGLYIWLAVGSLLKKSPTVDEKIHLAGGYSSLVTHDFRIDPEHPPLLKQFAALSLLFIKPNLPTDHIAWDQADTSGFGRLFFYYYGNDVNDILIPARIMMVFLGVLSIVFIYFWSKTLWGTTGGLLSATLAAMSPNYIAHSRLVATDAGAASFSIFLFVALYYYCKSPNIKRCVILGAVLGMTMLTKFSMLIWVPWIFICIFIVSNISKQKESENWILNGIKFSTVVAITVAIIITIGYFGSPASFWQGLHGLNQRVAEGHSAYLMGQCSNQGWIHYFLMVLALKTPLHVLAALFVSIVVIIKLPDAKKHAFFTIYPATLFFVVASISKHDIGVRHILPFYLLVFIWIGGIGSIKKWWARGLTLVVAVLSIITGITSYPDYIPYFNPIAGGENGGYRFLSDSNLDWGQDLKQLDSFIRHSTDIKQPVYLDYFGDKDLIKYYGLTVGKITPVEEYKPTSGTFAISMFKLQNVWAPSETRYNWLKQYAPVKKIGGSIWIFDVNPPDDAPDELRKQYEVTSWNQAMDTITMKKFLRSGWERVPETGDWVFPVSEEPPGYRAVERDPTISFSVPESKRGKPVFLTGDFFYLMCPHQNPQTLDISLNDREIISIDLQPGWNQKTIMFPRELVANGVNLIKFHSHQFVFPNEECLPSYEIGSTSIKSAVEIFLRAGHEGDRNYRDIIVDGNRIEVGSQQGYYTAVLDNNGNIVATGFFQMEKDNFPEQNITEFQAGLPVSEVVLGIGLVDTPFPSKTKPKLIWKDIGIKSYLGNGLNRAHVFIGVKGSELGDAMEKVSDGVIFLSIGHNQDSRPFAFGINNLSFH